jgi:RNA polymerase sigma-70 factor, ECF subfamily
MSKIDQSSFSENFKEYFVPLCQYAFTFCRDKDQSKEIVQDVFLKIWERRDEINIRGTVGVYLYQMVRNKSLNHIRDSKKLKFVSDDHQSALEHSEEDLPSESPLVKEQISAAIDVLPDRCKEIFILKRIEGLSYKQISVRLGLSEKTIENQMGIALKKLKESLQLVKDQLGEK